MSKVTDEMVDKFGKTFWGSNWQRGGFEQIRAALEAVSSIHEAEPVAWVPVDQIGQAHYIEIQTSLEHFASHWAEDEYTFKPLYAHPDPISKGVTVKAFQDRVAEAHLALFHDDPTDLSERRDRFYEEATETAQALGMTEADAHALVSYTFSRPVGEPEKEIGAAALTLASLCVVGGWDMMVCADADLAKLQQPATIERIRTKRLTRHGRGPLPGLSHNAGEIEAGGDHIADAGKMVGEFPERIWAGDFDGQGFGNAVAGMQGGLYEEYVRAEAADKRIAELEAALIEISRDTVQTAFGPKPTNGAKLARVFLKESQL